VRCVRVLWTDAAHIDELCADEVGGPIDGIAVGIMVEDEPTHITVALEIYEGGDYRRLLSIARPMVREIQELARVVSKDTMATQFSGG
jgi:hypothetical protein|tara:strand:- start:8721 stop:8984 length:264 start_codon:yes stop_codon:yes gene_type:complete